MTLLELDRISKLYPVSSGGVFRRLRRARPSFLHAVDDVSLTVAPGEAVGLVGESGCGKSTLLRLAARLLQPSSGRIGFNGATISDGSLGAFARSPTRSDIQVVFQDANDALAPHFSAFEAIAEPLRVMKGVRDRRALRARVGETASMVGLGHELLERLPHQLSGGQRARVGIARAIAPRPRLLLLDEPTSALDVSVQATVLHLLDRLRRQLDMAYLFVSHDLNVVRMLCDRVVVMYLGRIVEQGPVGRLMAEPQHPYTRILLEAIPKFGGGAAERLRPQGEPRSPIDPPPDECRFANRCPLVHEPCRRAMPALERVGTDHVAACYALPTVSAAPAERPAFADARLRARALGSLQR